MMNSEQTNILQNIYEWFFQAQRLCHINIKEFENLRKCKMSLNLIFLEKQKNIHKYSLKWIQMNLCAFQN